MEFLISNKKKGNLRYFFLLDCFNVLMRSAVEFFKEVRQFSLKVGPMLSGQYSSEWERRLEVSFQISVLLIEWMLRCYAVTDFGFSLLMTS